jgi:hypothetical protein
LGFQGSGYTDRIYFGATMDDFREVFWVFKVGVDPLLFLAVRTFVPVFYWTVVL